MSLLVVTFQNADWWPYGWSLDSVGCEPVWGLGRGDARSAAAAAAAAQIASTFEHLNTPLPRRQSYRRHAASADSLNFTTATADRCPRSGELFTETQACLLAVLGVVSMRR